MLTIVGKKLAAAVIVALSLAGCAATPEATPTSSIAAEATPNTLTADSITTIDDGIAWARSLGPSVTAEEMQAGVAKIAALMPDLDIWFEDNNRIGQALITLSADILSDPDHAGTKIPDLQQIASDIEVAVAKGNTP